MGKIRKIALLMCASNFERQRRVVRDVHEALQEMGDYALYVFSNYGLFYGDSPYNRGAKSIYQLVKKHDFDGVIIDSNLGDQTMMQEIADELKECNIPTVGLNVILEGIPYVIMDAYSAQVDLVGHLIHHHNCKKINFVGFAGADIFAEQALRAYKDVLAREGIPFEERRIVKKIVSVESGRELVEDFNRQGADDAEATICLHDVLAIGYCLEMEERGLRVPEDMRLCTLNYSFNSVAFRPTLTGTERQDAGISRRACQLLIDMMNGIEIPQENLYEEKIYFGQSCGCSMVEGTHEKKIYQDIILNKIGVGGQISRMMNYNDALERAESLSELGNSIFEMLEGDKGKEFLFCLNKSDIGYILNTLNDKSADNKQVLDDTMVAITGNLRDKGRIIDVEFPVNMLLPLHVKAGDIFIMMPIHHNERVFGYLVHINDYTLVDEYNHRISHESIGSSIENLRKQMILQNSIKELDDLHTHDALTGLFNRYAQERYKEHYIEAGAYTVVMIDMDGLKTINDSYGHLAGNNALCIMADALKACVDATDLLVRYAGDEFLVVSSITNRGHWEYFGERLNHNLKQRREQQKLPYELEASVGYSVCGKDEQRDFEECYEEADYNMYMNKKERKRRKRESVL
ncbi:MAG: GGDEF domain-containing protein [Lachnospiraceae bacterium]|nr:GGDEF domain-containing protein [Lachnospiraceae bacterium]